MTDPITDDDLVAFVDGELGAMRRLDVEAYLAAQPEAAARVMAEMRDRDALRASFAGSPGAGPERTLVLARRLDRALRWRAASTRLKRAAAIVVLVGAGWLAHDESGRFGVPDSLASPVDPALLADARQARAVAQLRAGMAGTGGWPDYDRVRLRAATGIALPNLPEGWRVRDLQVFPTRSGTGIEVAFDAAALGEASLFATRTVQGGPVEAGPTSIIGSGEGAVLSWTAGETAYALSGPEGEAALRQAARLLGADPAAR